MKETISVNVLEFDYEKGLRREVRRCPLGIALKRDHPEIYDFQIAAYEIFVQWVQGAEVEQYPLTKQAVDFIRIFDHCGGSDMKPRKIALFSH